MKKFLTLCAAIFAAMSMSADVINMTCAEAVAATALISKDSTGTDSVAITGYVTQVKSGISKGQQRFYMDDEVGTKQTVQAYYCNIPAGENPLVEGDKVKVLGRILNYNNTCEIKNGDVVILERANVKIDTFDVSICDAIEEGKALNAGDHTQNYYRVKGYVSSVDGTYEDYNQITFWLDCDDSTRLQAYRTILQEPIDPSLAGYPIAGDSVEVLGQITNYNGTIELTSSKVWLLAKTGVAPTVIRVNVAEALAIGDSLAQNETSKDEYLVVGYVDSITYAFNSDKKSMSFYMCDDMQAPAYEFQVYNGKTSVDIPVGTLVYCTGKIQHYYKKAEGENPEKDFIELVNAKISLTDPSSAISTFSEEKAGRKVFENGHIYIIYGDRKVSLLGVEVK